MRRNVRGALLILLGLVMAFSGAALYARYDRQANVAEQNAEILLTLNAAGYDASWNPVILPVEGAVLTVNGEKTDILTDENGNAVLTLAEAGTYTVSAVSETMTLVPPVCIVTVTE